MKRVLLTGVLLAAFGMAQAKLPPADDATKAKAAETAAKAGWQAKVDGYLLCKSQDKVAAAYRKTAATPTGAKPAAAPVMAAASAKAPAASAPALVASAPAAAASGTPVASAPLPPCSEPGPFAYNAPEQKPLEAAGAHSPTATAASPPSVKPNSAEMTTNKK